jgi:hypothetical protein
MFAQRCRPRGLSQGVVILDSLVEKYRRRYQAQRSDALRMVRSELHPERPSERFTAIVNAVGANLVEHRDNIVRQVAEVKAG